jgi:F-type H+-transporting ATPase subunit b
MSIAVLADQYLLWWAAQIVAVAILVYLALRWRPKFLKGQTVSGTLNAALDRREAQIREQLEAAERSRRDAARIHEEAQQDIVRARGEAEQIVTRAHQTSEAIGQEMEERARREYERVVGQAKAEIDYERRQAELALRRRAADIVVDAAGRVIERNLSADADRRIVRESLESLGDGQ